jgi:hypothetical protein
MSIIAMARMGRNGDTKMAHVTPGDLVVPRAAAKASPGLVAQVAGGIRKVGGDPQKYVVGSGNRNPRTGAEEFADPLVLAPGEPKQPLNQLDTVEQGYDGNTTDHRQDALRADYLAPGVKYTTDASASYNPDGSAATGGTKYASGANQAFSDVYGNLRTSGMTDQQATDYLNNKYADQIGQLTTLGYNPKDWQSQHNQRGGEIAAAAANGGGGVMQPPRGLVGGAGGAGGASGAYGAGGANGATQLGNPTTWNVDPSQTVEGRIASIIDPNNPIIQQARAQSLADANARGLSNSSMAQTAGDAAAYQAAIPIAQSDAATFAKAAGYNADEPNQFAVHNVDASNQFGLTGMSLASQQKIAAANNATQLEQAKIGAKSALDVAGTNSATQLGTAQISAQSQQAIAKLNAETNTATAQLDAASRERVASLQATNQTLINTNQQAAQAFNQAVVTVAAINQNTNMDATTKTQAIAQVWDTVNKSLKTLGAVSNTNVGSTLNFANYPGFDAQGNWVGFGATTGTGGGGIVGGAGSVGTV